MTRFPLFMALAALCLSVTAQAKLPDSYICMAHDETMITIFGSDAARLTRFLNSVRPKNPAAFRSDAKDLGHLPNALRGKKVKFLVPTKASFFVTVENKRYECEYENNDEL